MYILVVKKNILKFFFGILIMIDWESDINGELIINADDDKLNFDSTFYIVVYMDNPDDNLLLEK